MNRSTNPSHYYARQQPPETPTMQWSSPTWVERNGEAIAVTLGAVVVAIALGALVGAAVAGWLS